MKKTERNELVKVEQLEAEICFEIVELDDEMLSAVNGGLPPEPNIVQCRCTNIAC